MCPPGHGRFIVTQPKIIGLSRSRVKFDAQQLRPGTRLCQNTQAIHFREQIGRQDERSRIPRMRARRRGLMRLRLLTLTSAVLVAAGVAMLLYYAASRVDAGAGHRQGLDAFRTARAAQLTAETADAAGGTNGLESRGSVSAPLASAVGEPDKSLWSASRIADYDKFAAAEDIPEGIMRIPSVNLELPVFAGTRESNLTRGAGRIEGTPALDGEGNTGVAAHRDGYFRALKDVALGDIIEVETMSGVEQFRITDLMIVEPEDVHVLDPTTERSLTLVTCYPFYYVGSAPQRFIVRGTRL
jgi:LPXTG-site transpeptidase (sortase) family protein